jgi:chromate reductase
MRHNTCLEWSRGISNRSIHRQRRQAGKPGRVTGISICVLGAATGKLRLRNILAYIDMPVLGQPSLFLRMKEGLLDDAGGFANPDTRRFLQGWTDRYMVWARKHKA